MANAYVQVAPDSTGKKMQTFENTVSGQVVEAEAVTLVRSSDNTEIGTATQPVRVDPVGTTTQPVQDSAAETSLATLAGSISAGVAQDNVSQWGGTAVQAAATASNDGTGANPVVRNIPRRYGQILTTANLGNGGNYTSAWFDTTQTGDVYVEASVFSDKANALNGFLIQETDDTTNSNFTVNVTASAIQSYGLGQNVGANALTTIYAVIRKRYYRVSYTNGVTPTTSFELTLNASNFAIPSILMSSNTTLFGLVPSVTAASTASAADGASNNSTVALGSNGAAIYSYVYPSGFNGATWDRLRTPNKFFTVSATAFGNTAVWTPTTGKKFRLMRFQIELSENAALAAPALLTVQFQDATTGIGFAFDIYVSTALTANGESWRSGWIDLGNGILSAAANNVLNFNISGAANLTTGNFRINVGGTEE